MKPFNQARKYLSTGYAKAGAALTVGLMSAPVFAADPDYSTLTDAVDFSEVGTAILAVAAALVGVYIVWKGAKMILAAVRGG